MKNAKEINWKYYIIELLVVFLGVTGGFLLNTWRENNSELKLEQKYLNSFYNAILADEASLDSLIIHSQLKADNLMSVMLDTANGKKLLSEENAQNIVSEILHLEWFSPSTDAYEDIKNSGNLNLISDYKLKEKLSSYYQFLKEVKSVEKFYLDHINNYAFPILYKNYHLLEGTFTNKNSYQNLKFTNMYLATLALLQQRLRTYNDVIDKNHKLKKELAELLNIKSIK